MAFYHAGGRRHRGCCEVSRSGGATCEDVAALLEEAWIPSRIEWDLTNGPRSKLLELLDTQVEGSVQWVLLEISWMDVKCDLFTESEVSFTNDFIISLDYRLTVLPQSLWEINYYLDVSFNYSSGGSHIIGWRLGS